MRATVDFLVRAAREFGAGEWVFTGFHWPVLAGQLATELRPADGPVLCYEAGAATWGVAPQVPTSTTDYPAYADAIGYRAGTTDVLLAMARRFDRVVLDAGTVDMRGRVNSSFIGERARPSVRLPGGGGAPDIAGAARELVWLHGESDPGRLQATVEHVTAAPGPQTAVRLHTRWGELRLGAAPKQLSIADGPGLDRFLTRLKELEVVVDRAVPAPCVTADERARARDLLARAAERGYRVAGRALEECS
jgi:glutaconate CoA-transferase subunit B